MEKLIFDSVQEIFLFDLAEMIFLLCFYMIKSRIKVNKIQFIYNLGILTILDFIMSALNLPIVMQIIFIFAVVIYLQKFFQLTFIQNAIIIGKCFVIVIIVENLYIIIFKFIFDIQLISMPLNIIRFYYLIPLRIIEFTILLYLNYKNKNNNIKGGEFHYEKR